MSAISLHDRKTHYGAGMAVVPLFIVNRYVCCSRDDRCLEEDLSLEAGRSEEHHFDFGIQDYDHNS